MRRFFILILIFFASALNAQEWEDRKLYPAADSARILRILSSTDTVFFDPIIKNFQQSNPSISVEYFVTGTAQIDKIYRQNPTGFDLIISSAMDLQLKMVNDGLAQAVADLGLPEWAQWRQSLFAFTTEPAAIVINRQAFEGYDIPQSRQDLIQAMRARPTTFSGRVGTYDVRQSGLGYLFATQDARASETFWRLTEVMGSLDAKLYCCSGQMIDDLLKGDILVAYNVLGSYANARKDEDDLIEVILPSDFPTTMMRTAFVGANSTEPESAIAFLSHLISYQSQGRPQEGSTLPLLDQATSSSTIPLEPALMTYLDRLKRQTFLSEWESAIIQ